MNDSIREWARAAGIRAIKTSAQTAVAIISVGTVMQDVDWAMVASASALSAVLSILTSIAGIPEVHGGSSVAQIADSQNEGE